ncbi:MAG TPA: cyclase family protein [Xanthomonadales bacterium]|nr:cyclase family protein [Xanthomonadales bacterium]
MLFESRSAMAFLAMVLAFSVSTVEAVNDEPLEENWAPGEWGPDDLIGAVNRITPELVLAAVGLVKQGKVATLGKTYQADMPTFPGRSWKLTIPRGGPQSWGPQQLVGNEELVTAELGQVGTQFDGPGHIGIRTSQGDYFYNGRFLEEVGTPTGLGPLGVEHIAEIGFVCRGVLLDAAKYRGMEILPIPASPPNQGDPGIITDEDVRNMIEAQGIAPIKEGDCVFLYTGHGNLWHPREWDTFSAEEKAKRTAEFNSGQPGFGISACHYLAGRKIILMGADNWSTEATAAGTFAGENEQPFECHLTMMPKHGIWNIENLDLTQLVEDGVSEFLFVWSPLKMKGATGSPGNPVALY